MEDQRSGNENGTEKTDGVTELVRLKLFNQQLKIVALSNRLEALNQRKQSISLELSVIPEKIKTAEDEQKKLLEDYKSRYAKLKEEAGVPDGHELNLETGEIVNVQQQGA